MSSSHLISPHRKMPAKPMNPSIKKWIKWMRIIQLVLRCLELISSVGVLVLMVLIKGVDLAIGWIIRIAVCHSEMQSYGGRLLIQLISLELQFFTQLTVSFIWQGNHLGGLQHHLRHI